MHKHTTMTTGRASLCALGEYLRRHCFFAPLREHVQIRQKTVRYRPIDKLLDALSGMLCGAKSVAQNNITIRTDRAVQRAFGRTGCAEQSTIARTLWACTAANVAQLDKVSWYYLKRYGAIPRHRFHDKLLWVDIDLTPMPIGAKAEGSERTWMGRNRSKTGRKTLWITANQYREDPPRDVAPGEGDRCAGLESRAAGGRNSSGVEPRTSGPDCAPPGRGLWDHRGPLGS
jgi:hypothetical protein